jgi:hypothetical protein
VSLNVSERQVTSLLVIASLLSSGIRGCRGTGDLSELAGIDAALSSAAYPEVEGWSDLVESQNGLGTILTKGLDLCFTIRDPGGSGSPEMERASSVATATSVGSRFQKAS